MKMITTTINKEYMDEILTGVKKIEYKGKTEFWEKRLEKLMKILENKIEEVEINFLCGQKAYKYHVRKIVKINLSQYGGREIAGIRYDEFYQIHLGERFM